LPSGLSPLLPSAAAALLAATAAATARPDITLTTTPALVHAGEVAGYDSDSGDRGPGASARTSCRPR